MDATNFKIKNEDFEHVFYDSKLKSITCFLSENVSLILKWTNQDTVIIIAKGKKRIVLPMKLFNCICDSKVTVSFLEQK